MQFGYVHGGGREPRLGGAPDRSQGGRRGPGEVPHPETLSVHPVVDAPDPRRPVAEFAGPVASGEHHSASTVGFGRQVGGPQRIGHHCTG